MREWNCFNLKVNVPLGISPVEFDGTKQYQTGSKGIYIGQGSSKRTGSIFQIGKKCSSTFLSEGTTTETVLRGACTMVVDSDPASDLLFTSYAIRI